MTSNDYIDFLSTHIEDNIYELSLKLNPKDYSFNLKDALYQLSIRQKVKDKLPDFTTNLQYIFPSKISVEQSSSKTSALYKREIISKISKELVLKNGIDLTGGLGCDSYYLSSLFEKFVYLEQDESLSKLAESNFKTLDIHNIIVMNFKAEDFIKTNMFEHDLIYADPSRRNLKTNIREVSTEGYTPNIFGLKDEILKHSSFLMIKFSPMSDIQYLLRKLPETIEVHVVSIDNECKELLFLLKKESKLSYDQVEIICVDLVNSNSAKIIAKSKFLFNLLEEKSSNFSKSDVNSFKYLYEPSSSILKAGAFKLISKKFNVSKLDTNTHLYVSKEPVRNFPGRSFKIINLLHFNKESIRLIESSIDKANVSARNFPISSENLKSRLKINDGGEIYIFGTVINSNEKILLICRKD